METPLSEDEGISDLTESSTAAETAKDKRDLEKNSSQCINPQCENLKTEMVFSANHYILSYFGFEMNEKKKICEICFDFFQKNRLPALEKPSVPDMEYDDAMKKRLDERIKKLLEDEDSTDHSDYSEFEMPSEPESDEDIVCIPNSMTREEIEEMAKNMEKTEDLILEHEMEQLDLDIDQIRKQFEDVLNQRTEKVQTSHMETAEGNEEVLKKTEYFIPEKPELRLVTKKPIRDQIPLLPSGGQISRPASLKDSDPSSPQELLTPSRPSSPEEQLPPLPPTGPIEKPPFNTGDAAYAMRPNNQQEWKLCKITEKKAESSDYKIRFDGIQSKKNSPNRTVLGKHLAYVAPSKYKLPVGTRCIAIYREEPELKERFFAAIIAEVPQLKNLNRYLVFFDDGYTAYLPHDDLRVVADPSVDVWDDVPEDSREFTRNYLLQYPNRPILRLAVNDHVETELNGKWLEARVLDLDASLVKLDFGEENDIEWVYRGSSRLRPIFTMEGTKRARELEGLPGKAPPEDVIMEQMEVACLIKNGQVVSEEVYEVPKKWEMHDCDWQCISGPGLGYKDGDDLEENLLMIPIKHGWVRRVFQYYEMEKRCVEYVAPCGRRLRNMEEVHVYLTLTGSQMEIDFFNVDWWVHVQNRFQPEKELVMMKDMSFGKENVPVSLVNSIDLEYPEFLMYSRVRLPQDNVKIPLDPEFLVCCDCEDDCSDEKCDCRKLTKQDAGGAVVTGYEYKRLQDNVLTGIYECNSRCKCRHTCLNRVAQKPLRGKLQMFKTVNRGWGIRSLVDIPQGAFICVYVGHLYESDEADNLKSDEYFAQLDLIEVAEEEKGGYVNDDDDEGFAEDEDSSKSVQLSQMDGVVSESDMEVDPEKEKRSEANPEVESDPEKNGKSKSEVEPEPKKHCESKMEINITKKIAGPGQNKPLRSVRRCFARLEGRKEEPYVMDAKMMGNIGRYMNHSCNPNVFVQNVFVDTHDLRFPWVAFFAYTFIQAGDELCWNYNYELLETGEPLMCNCGTKSCKGRLL